MFSWVKSTCFDERNRPSSNRVVMFIIFGLAAFAFFFGAWASWTGEKLATEWSLKALQWLGGTGGFVGAVGQVKSWLVQKETITSTTVTAISAAPPSARSSPTDEPASAVPTS